ncbi:hypothetical protein BDN71DRAFT_1453221 [Pleurotus eryngii]|uniref:Uncharacterized protein n=1 Tax=Pleurotus eryngii TaxID=5323 RepID=A0A9P5ZPR4_PLEER|nr:hypothetical protein BDN71DRAFT_1453221 [Pleurotus eryngii]
MSYPAGATKTFCRQPYTSGQQILPTSEREVDSIRPEQSVNRTREATKKELAGWPNPRCVLLDIWIVGTWKVLLRS